MSVTVQSDSFWSLIFTVLFSYRDLLYAGIYYIFPSKGTERETISHTHHGKKAEQLEVLSTSFVNTSLCSSVYSSLPFVDQDKIFCFPTHCQIPALLNTQEMLGNVFRRKSSKQSNKQTTECKTCTVLFLHLSMISIFLPNYKFNLVI